MPLVFVGVGKAGLIKLVSSERCPLLARREMPVMLPFCDDTPEHIRNILQVPSCLDQAGIMSEGLVDISILLTFKLKTIVKKAGLDRDAGKAMVMSSARGALSLNNISAWYCVFVSLAVELLVDSPLFCRVFYFSDLGCCTDNDWTQWKI